MRKHLVFTILGVSLTCSACSSRPRSFAPRMAAPSSDPAAFDAAWKRCRAEVAARTDQRSGRLASGAAGVAAGAGATAAVGAATAGTYATYGSMAAAMGATIIAAPVALIGGAWGRQQDQEERKGKGDQGRNSGLHQSGGLRRCRLARHVKERSTGDRRYSIDQAVTLNVSPLP